MARLLPLLLLATLMAAESGCAKATFSIVVVDLSAQGTLPAFDGLRLQLSPPRRMAEHHDYPGSGLGNLSATVPADLGARIGVRVSALSGGAEVAAGEAMLDVKAGQVQHVAVQLAPLALDGGADGGPIAGDGGDGGADLSPPPPPTIEMVAPDEANVGALAVSHGVACWLSLGQIDAPLPEDRGSARCATGPSIITLASAQLNPADIVVVSANPLSVAWTTFGNSDPQDASGTVMQYHDGMMSQLAGGQPHTSGLTSSLTGTFWGVLGNLSPNQGAVVWLEPGGGAPTSLVPNLNNPLRLIADDLSVYWLEIGTGSVPRGRVSVKQPGGNAARVLGDQQPGPIDLVLDPQTGSIFWANGGDVASEGTIMRARTDGAMPAETVEMGIVGISGLAVDATYIYWTTSDGNLVRRDKAGGTPQTLLSGLDGPAIMRIDEGYLYWVNGASAPASSVVRIRR